MKGAIVWETLKPGEKDSAGDKVRRNMGPDGMYYQSKSVSRLLIIFLVSTHISDEVGTARVIFS